VRALFATALEAGVIRVNPCAGIRLPAGRVGAEEGGHVRALTSDELARLVEHVPDNHRLLVRLLAETGLRASELVALRWGDVDFGANPLSVRRRVYRGTIAPKGPRFESARRLGSWR
jgi:integrase